MKKVQNNQVSKQTIPVLIATASWILKEVILVDILLTMDIIKCILKVLSG